MDIRKSSASARTKTTHDVHRIPGDRGRFLRGLSLSRRKHSVTGYFDRPEHIAGGIYRVPSLTLPYLRYKVDTNEPSCGCEDFERGHTCQHLLCAMILESRQRVRRARLVRCSGCPARVQHGDITEVSDEHAEWHLGFFGGELLCPSCARRAGLET